jgi:hypothetical protein
LAPPFPYDFQLTGKLTDHRPPETSEPPDFPLGIVLRNSVERYTTAEQERNTGLTAETGPRSAERDRSGSELTPQRPGQTQSFSGRGSPPRPGKVPSLR